MQYQQENIYYVLVIDRGEKVVETLTRFCREKNIEGGMFTGLGAVENPTLAHYSVPSKKYSKKTLEGAFELTNITGSIGIETDLIIHAHVTVSNEKMEAFGGHLVETTVGGTLEILLLPTNKLSKKMDTETGLKLFHLAAKI